MVKALAIAGLRLKVYAAEKMNESNIQTARVKETMR